MGHAEIAGAGFAGLAFGAMLAQRGWSVVVHERRKEIDEIGAGIFIHHNGLLVLDELGLMAELAEDGVQLRRRRMIDERGRVLQDLSMTSYAETWSFPRRTLIQALYKAAKDSGVTIELASQIEGAEAGGSLAHSDGRTLRADIVIGADGYRSKVRRSLGLTRTEKSINTTSIRFLYPSRDLAVDPATTEYWSGRRRVAFAACGPQHTYVYMACPQKDDVGSRVPLDVDSWSRSFPMLHDAFEALQSVEPHRSSYSLVKTQAWSKGKAALVGDAAHCLPPTLGQGTNLALSNVRSLATFLDHYPVDAALSEWETRVRRVTDTTQRWAGYYDAITKYWPESQSWLRGMIVHTFGAVPWLHDRLRLANRTSPILEIGGPS